MAYRLLLGREPESGAVVEEYARSTSDLKSLRERFLYSEEFASSRVVRLPLSLDRGKSLRVDVDVDRHILEQMLSRVEHTWRALGTAEPFWSVLSSEAYKRDNFAANARPFHDSGKEDLARLNFWLERNGIVDFGRNHVCCEYGCGTGRVTRWLATQFSSVIACDISLPHIQLAQQHLQQSNVSNVQFRQIETLSTLRAMEPVDAVFTFMVLQHNPPPVIAFIVTSMLQWLKPGGLAFFQVPTYCPGYSFISADYLAAESSGRIEMHLLPQKHVYAIAEREDCEVLEVEPDGFVGSPQWISNTFLLRKRT